MPLVDNIWPIFSSAKEGVSPAENSGNNILYWGYLSLGVAGGIQLWDRVIGNTNSWIRFIKAELELKKIKHLFEDEWNRITMDSDFENISKTEITEITKIINAFNKEVHNLVKEETKSWADTYTKGLSVLNEKINSMKTAFEEDIDQFELEKEKAKEEADDLKTKEFGYLRIEIKNATDFESVGVLLFDDDMVQVGKDQTLENGSKDAIFPKLKIGKYILETMGHLKGQKASKKLFVDIKPLEVTEQAITIPKINTPKPKDEK